MAQLTGTLANFIVRIRRFLREETASTSQWSDNFLKQVFNNVYRLRSTEAVMAHEGFFTHIGQRNLVANQGRYAWPTGFSRLQKIELVRTDGRRIPLQRDERHFEALSFPDATGQDSYLPTWRPVGSGFVLEPAPGVSVTNGLLLEWNGVPDELVADDDTLHTDFPQEYHELLVLDTVATAFDQEGLMETGQPRTVLRLRAEWELRWERYLDGRSVSTNNVTPFAVHYQDA